MNGKRVILTRKGGESRVVGVVKGEVEAYFHVCIEESERAQAFLKSEWNIEYPVEVPTGLGAVVEGKDGKRWVRCHYVQYGINTWRAMNGTWETNTHIASILRDGGKVLSEGVK